jgi:hypothetical protein
MLDSAKGICAEFAEWSYAEAVPPLAGAAALPSLVVLVAQRGGSNVT